MFGKINQADSTKQSIPSKKTILENKKRKPPTKNQLQYNKNSKEKIMDKINDKLQGSSFRMLNELLYSTNSKDALVHFKDNPDDFKQYHSGFQSQVNKWPENPVNLIIKILTSDTIDRQNIVVIDLGCGDGQIYEHFVSNPSQKIKRVVSYDLKANKPFIIEGDIANLPRKDLSCDVAIFSLSLMGINYLQFILEAFRVTRKGGYLIIAEVASRMENFQAFIKLVELVGYKMKTKDQRNVYFILLVFQKVQDKAKISFNSKVKESDSIKLGVDSGFTYSEVSELILKPCLYKKR